MLARLFGMGGGMDIRNRGGRRTGIVGSAPRVYRHAQHRVRIVIGMVDNCIYNCVVMAASCALMSANLDGDHLVVVHFIRSFGPMILGKLRTLYAHYVLTNAYGRI